MWLRMVWTFVRLAGRERTFVAILPQGLDSD